MYKERVSILYIIHNLIERIKLQAKTKGKKTTDMLEHCGLNKNMLSSMNTRGSWIQANNLGMIADYLDCSVDYLLCRSENPNAHKTHSSDVVVDPYGDEQLAAIIEAYKQLDTVGKAKLLVSADNLINSVKLQDENVMKKYLSGSYETGKKILDNLSDFICYLDRAESYENGKTIYYFKWAFCNQKGTISILVKEQKISDSSLIQTDADSPHPFGRPLGLYNDSTLRDVFLRLMEKEKIIITGFYSE